MAKKKVNFLTDWKIAALCLLLTCLSLLYTQIMGAESYVQGFPFAMISTSYGLPPSGTQFNAVNIAVDLVFWYLISYLLVAVIIPRFR